MAITASGLYGLTLQKMTYSTLATSLDGETNNLALVTDSESPLFDTHDFHADLTGEVPNGSGYTTGGATITTTAVSLTSGVLDYDCDPVSWASSTISNAMASIHITNVSGTATDELVVLQDFVTAVSTTNGTLTVTPHANGVFTLDYTP
jgi:hypothetical protein